jgi:hypothetical protein
MWNWIVERLWDEPEKMIERGQTCAWVGSTALLVGVIGMAAKHMVGVARDLAGQGGSPSLADLGWSPWLTFWVPESGFGVFVLLSLAGFGFWSVTAGRALKRAYG